jgi:serine protease Do
MLMVSNIARRQSAKVQPGSLILGVVIGAALVGSFGLGRLTGQKENSQVQPIKIENGVASGSNSPVVEGGTIRPPSIGDIAEMASKSVVNIDTMKNVQIAPWSMGFGDSVFGGLGFGSPLLMQPQISQSRGVGSGVIIKSDGYILTNRHVVGDADAIKVTLSDKRAFDGKVVGRDSITDLALVKIDARDLPVAKIGSSKLVRPGDWAIAIGSPLGFDHSVTLGIVSALDRSIDEVSQQAKLIQTDAAINPGNSGGPLLNINGQVVGIITAISRQGQNIGFAIPSDLFEQIVNQLLTKGHVSRPYIGLHMQDLTPPVAEELGLGPDIKGVVVDKVYGGSPAEKAGIGVGDLITAIDGQTVTNAKELGALARGHKIGDVIKFALLRQGQKTTSALTVGDFQADN